MEKDWKDILSKLHVPDAETTEIVEIKKVVKKDKLIVVTDTKHRKGKIVTIVSGFTCDEDEINEVAKQLKSKCGTGGSVKDNTIIIQGDLKTKLTTLLTQDGYQIKGKK